jgi:hypothetical protein
MWEQILQDIGSVFILFLILAFTMAGLKKK